MNSCDKCGWGPLHEDESRCDNCIVREFGHRLAVGLFVASAVLVVCVHALTR